MKRNCTAKVMLSVSGLFAVVAVSLAAEATADLPKNLSASVNKTPANRFERAQAHRSSGDLEAALQELAGLRVEFPSDVDYALARAQVLAELQRDDEALDELVAATALAPDYEAVWRLRLRVMARQKDEGAELRTAALRRMAAERFPDARWWQSAGVAGKARWMLLVGASHEMLNRQFPDWNSQFVELHLEQNASSQFRFRIGRNERGATADTSFDLGTERLLPRGWLAGFEISGAGGPNFQPELGYSGHLGKTLSEGWAVDFRYRRREYSTATVGSAIGTVEKYFDAFRVAYGLGLSRLHGASSFTNHVLTVNWYYNDRSSLGFTVNSGKEAESIGNGQVLETDVRGISLSGRHRLNNRFGLQWWFGVHDQGDFYRRQFLGMAVSIRI